MQISKPIILHSSSFSMPSWFSFVLCLFLWVGVMSATSRFRPAAVNRPINRLLPHKLTWLFNGDLNVTSHPLLRSHCTWRTLHYICPDWSIIKSSHWEKSNIPTPFIQHIKWYKCGQQPSSCVISSEIHVFMLWLFFFTFELQMYSTVWCCNFYLLQFFMPPIHYLLY